LRSFPAAGSRTGTSKDGPRRVATMLSYFPSCTCTPIWVRFGNFFFARKTGAKGENSGDFPGISWFFGRCGECAWTPECHDVTLCNWRLSIADCRLRDRSADDPDARRFGGHGPHSSRAACRDAFEHNHLTTKAPRKTRLKGTRHNANIYRTTPRSKRRFKIDVNRGAIGGWELTAGAGLGHRGVELLGGGTAA
jgi:hypothetical protein